ncbi:MAG: GNAT family N-acetyltransferase [Thermodesulfobacteriota bacterium]
MAYEDRTYRIYAIDITGFNGSLPEDGDFTYKLVDADDIDCIDQIECMEEWLWGRVKNKLENGFLCLAAMDGPTVAGFNIVALEEGSLPLVHFTRKLRPHESWSVQITVRKNYRGKKLASTLRNRIFAILRDSGVKKLYGGTNVSNVASLQLARKVGFKELADYRYRKVFNNTRFTCTRVRT